MTPMELHPLIQLAALVLGPAGACWAVLNGTRSKVHETLDDVKDIRRTLDAHEREIRSTLADHGERLVAIETTIKQPRPPIA